MLVPGLVVLVGKDGARGVGEVRGHGTSRGRRRRRRGASLLERDGAARAARGAGSVVRRDAAVVRRGLGRLAEHARRAKQHKEQRRARHSRSRRFAVVDRAEGAAASDFASPH